MDFDLGSICNRLKLYYGNDPGDHDQPEGTRFKSFWRFCFILSIAVPMFVSLLIMRTMLQPSGAVNTLLMNLGLITKPLPFYQCDLGAGYGYRDQFMGWYPVYHAASDRYSPEYSGRIV